MLLVLTRVDCRLVNYEHEHLNVGLPVLSIHGNHDDPGGPDHLAALDVLSAAKLVNYFGKVVRWEKVA